MEGTALVTGANRGIGYEMCRKLVDQGVRVVAGCRRATDALRELGVTVVEGLDVTSDEDVARLDHELGDARLDLLINNAGLLEMDSLHRLDFESIRRQFEVNALGPLRVTRGLLDRIPEGGKVGLVTSRMGSIEDNTSGGQYGYRMSKAALNMAGKSLAEDLRSRGIAVAIVHPGFVKTEMTGNRGNVEPPHAAAGILQRLEELDLEQTGGFWHADGQRLPW